MSSIYNGNIEGMWSEVLGIDTFVVVDLDVVGACLDQWWWANQVVVRESDSIIS